MGQFDFTTGQTAIKLDDHSARHEDGGADEISLTGLSGDPADTINESLLTTQNDIIVRGASIAERLNITEQTLVGRLTGGNVSAVALGISDNNIAQIDGTSNAPAPLDYAKFTTSGLEGKSYQELVNDISGVIKATDVEVAELSTATYDDVQDYINFFGDRTYLTGCTITADGDGKVSVASGTAWCRESDSDTAVGKFFNFAGQSAIALTDMVANLLYLDYNAGTPQVVVATSALTYGFQQDHILIGVVFLNGTDCHILQADPIGIEGANRSHMMRVEEGARRASGMVTTAIGTRNLAVTAGVFHLGLNRKTTPPFTTPNSGTADDTEAYKLHDADGGFVATDVGKIVHNTTDDTYAFVTAYVDAGELTLDSDIFVSGENYDLDVFSYWYYDGDLETPAWVEVPGSTAISNTQYNDVDTGLANLTVNKYGVHWVYMDFGGHINVVYGQGNYSANEAEVATVPSSLPNVATNFSVIIAKIICQQGQDTMIITHPWTEIFLSSLATDHGSLGGLGDDDHPQYLLADGTRALSGAWDMGSQNLTNVDIDSGTIDGADITIGSGKTLDVSAGTLTLADNQISGDKVEGGTIAAITISQLTLDATQLTVTGAELNLLDLAGLTAGEVLVATGAATAAWQSTGVKLSAPDISGVVTAASALTMPAFTLNGTVTLNGQVLDAGSAWGAVNTTGALRGLYFKSTQDSATGVELWGEHVSAAATDDDILFRILASGRDDAQAPQEYCRIDFRIEDATAATPAGKMEFSSIAGASWNLGMTLSSAGDLWIDRNLGIGGTLTGVTTLTATTVNTTSLGATSLAGTLTGGANTISGSAFDIDGGTIDGVTIGGAVAPTVTNLGAVTTCDINGGTIAGVTVDGDLTWSSAQSGLTLTAPTLNGTITLGATPVFDAGSGNARINTTGAQKGLVIQCTNDGTIGPYLEMYQLSTSPLAGDTIFNITAFGEDSADNKQWYGEFNCVIDDPTSTSEDSSYKWRLMNAGATNWVMILDGAGELWVDTFVNPDEGVKVSGTQVVAAQGAAVADATDAADVILRLNELLARCRAHGLIAT